MNKIPTAEEFVQSFPMYFPQYTADAYEGLRVFAQLHVEATLKAVINNLELEIDSSGIFQSINEESILNAYPKENIK